MRRALFLDRDGVLIEQVEYLSDPDRVALVPGAAAAVAEARASGWLVLVVSNQSGIARGRFRREDLDTVQERLAALLRAEGTGLDGFYFCPHDPHREQCSCRKPAPGMLLRAARDFDVDIARSAMVGDRLTDLAAGRSAGCRRGVLVRTGYGPENAAEAERLGWLVVDALPQAIRRILSDAATLSPNGVPPF